MGDINSQLSLLSTLTAYERAEQANVWFPGNRDQEAKSDQLFMRLTHAAFACGFEPAGFHRNLSVVEFCRQRAAVLRRVFPNHIQQAGL